MAIIQFKDVWEMYRIKFVVDNKASWENFWALKGINFEIEKGEALGIIGENGAGKSTLLKLIAGMLKPDRGEIMVSGRVCGLLELGAGFQPELTGRDNLYLNAGLFGLTQTQIEERYEKITDFASLGKFINAPVKCYSQGMFVRLAFSIAIHIDPDILLIDDILAVGDEYFQRKCIKKVFELKEAGKIIIFVSHDMNILSRLCKRAIFLKEGRVVKDDATARVIPLYSQMVGAKEGVGILEKAPLKLVFNNGRLLLNWQDKLLTPHSGAHTFFFAKEKWHSSLQAEWEVKKENENKLVAIGRFYPLALTQFWNLEITPAGEIKWDIEMESEGPFEIQEGHANIMLTDEYTHWFTPMGKGEFPPIDDKNKDWQILSGDNLTLRAMGVAVKEMSGGNIPSLVFQQSSAIASTSGRILNADYFANSRVLQYKMRGLQDYSRAQTNRFIYFSGEIIINTPDVDNYLKNMENEFTLSNGKLKLIFDHGRCLLSYDGRVLTKSNHMKSVIYVNGRWHSSHSACWEVKKEKEGNKIIAKGIWQGLPIIQIWEIDITSEHAFLWKIRLRIEKGLDITEQLVEFMVAETYTSWFSEYGLGQFPGIFFEDSLDVLQRCVLDGAVMLRSQSQ
ncbi:MAG: ABC transporter ATP-binding protein, partial [Candidatus Omnitrophica bacterium]|nr:ABC transporter ATP-binding protein [Candidatus Omnitrophota bacterium]